MSKASERELVTLTLGTLRLVRIIARTHSSTVYLAQSTTTDAAYAVKHISASPQHLHQINIHRHAAMAFPSCVVPLLEASLTIPPDEGYLIIMPFYGMGTLNDYLKKNPTLDMAARMDLLHQVLDAVVKCHSIGLYHRDLKLENFCVSQQDGQVCVWLNDFGLATHEAFTRTRGCGSIGYMPPEAIESIRTKQQHAAMMDASKQDTWSLAMVVVNVLFMVCTWRVADESDQLYALYRQCTDSYFLMTLPITPEVNRVLLKAFSPCWRTRCSVAEFVYEMKHAMKQGMECTRDEFLQRSQRFKGVMEHHVPGCTAYPSPVATAD